MVATLGAAQTLAWASTYYLPAILAVPMARDLGVSTPTLFAFFSIALTLSALLGPRVGQAIDRWGGRAVLMVSSLIFALGLGTLAVARGPTGLLIAWLILGAGMGLGLYEAAFASLVRLYGHDARGLITGVTLIAGFASTIGWPMTAWFEAEIGWRGACWTWAGIHLLLGLPLNATLRKTRATAITTPAMAQAATGGAHHTRLTAWLLAFTFAATGFVSTAMATHLPRLLQVHGADLAAAVLAGAMVGPAQVAGRLFEFTILRRVHPLTSARIASVLPPLGAGLFALLGTPLVAAFALLHGAGNGMLTIAKGTLPLALYGPAAYGRRQGLLMAPARIAQALAPWLFGLWLEHLGVGVMWVLVSIGLAAFGGLLLLRTGSR